MFLGFSSAAEPIPPLDAAARAHVAGMAAHHLCAGLFVVGRDHDRPVEEILGNDIARFSFTVIGA